MDFNGNTPEGEPGPSKMPNVNQAFIDEMEAGPSNARKRNVPYGGPYYMERDESDESDDGFETGDNTAPSTTSSTIKYEKRRRLNSCQDYTDSDGFFSVSSDSEPIYAIPISVSRNAPNYPNIYIPEYQPLPYDLNLQYIPGYWLLITNLIGGWNKRQVKRYFIRNLGVRFYKSKPFPGVFLGPNGFRLMLHFACKESRDFVIKYIRSRYYEILFNYIPIDQIPFGSLEPESDDDNNGGAYYVA